MELINNVNFKEKAEFFIDDLKKKGRSDSTVIAYAKDIEQLLNYFSAKGIGALEKVTIKNLEAYRQNLQDSNYTPKSISLCRSEERRVGKECRSRWSPYH